MNVQKARARSSLSKKISMMVLVMVVVCSAVIGLISYVIYRRDSITSSAERAGAIAKTFAAAINGDDLAVAAETGEKTPYWHVVKAAADKTRDETGVMYFYIISHVEGDNAVYLVDALGEESSDLGDTDAVENFADKMYETLNTGSPQITGIYDSGDYGYLVAGFAPVLNSAGEVVGVVGADILMDDVLNASNVFGFQIIGIVAGFSILFGFVTMWYIRRRVGQPLAVLAKASDRISLGETDIELAIHSNDEIGLLADAFHSMTESTHRQMDVLETIANRDLSADIAPRSDGDAMTFSIRRLTGTLNDMFREIQSSTSQVSTGSKQIADGAQQLALGSTEQGMAVEQLSTAISDVALKTKANAKRAEKAADLAETIKGNAEKGSRQMERMMQAVKEINEASQSIGKVIKVIDDIAFQTNILALNAAVEAARAGQHGKGFAVVADEVRNLAAKSAIAAKDTGQLIANSIDKAELGAGIARETSHSLGEIVEGIVESTQIVQEIAQSSVEQSGAIDEINSGIERIAHVVQQNSATAEQSAAASEEMSSQSDMLNQMVSQFKLSRDTGMRL